MATPADTEAARLARAEMVLEAVRDIQGSIHANDSKSAAGLVVHGLLFAGITTITTHVGTLYGLAAEPGRVVAGVLLSGAAVAFAVSVGFLVAAVVPYEPRQFGQKLGESAHIWFPQIDLWRKRDAAFGSFLELIKRRDPDGVLEVYAAELLKVADIREHVATQARRGFRWLPVAGGLALLYLLSLALVGLGCPWLARSSQSQGAPPRLQWTVVAASGAKRTYIGGGELRVSRRAGPLTLLLKGSAVGVTSVELSRRFSGMCSSKPRAGPRSIDALPPPGRETAVVNPGVGSQAIQLRSQETFAGLGCPPHARFASGEVDLIGVASTRDGGQTRGELRVAVRR